MGPIFALDPGLTNAGLAVALPGAGLVWARDVTFPFAQPRAMVGHLSELLSTLPPGGHLVSEWPEKYPHKRIAWATVEAMREVVRRVEAARKWASHERVKPGAWSRTVPKRIRNLRVEESLSGPERAVWDGLGMDGKDAAALALWRLRVWESEGR